MSALRAPSRSRDPYAARYSGRKRVPLRDIRAVARRIGVQFHADQIILFGSHATGEAKPWSDVDLLVVMDTPLTPNQQRRAISEFLYPKPFSLDIVIWSARELQERIREGDWFLKEAVERGKVLYEKAGR